VTEQTRKSISYALNFLTFLFLERDAEGKILSVYLFGSAVRGELNQDSDIDIFINCKNIDEEFILKRAEIARRKFVSSKDFDKWKALDFTHPLSVKAGNLAEWQLKTSISAEGIELYSKEVQAQNTERIVVFSFELPKSKKSYLKIRRELFGRAEKNYKSEGAVAKAGGKQMSSNLFLVPVSKQNYFIKLLHADKIKFSMMEMRRVAG
jgi:predicted nucleotidyltransferase